MLPSIDILIFWLIILILQCQYTVIFSTLDKFFFIYSLQSLVAWSWELYTSNLLLVHREGSDIHLNDQDLILAERLLVRSMAVCLSSFSMDINQSFKLAPSVECAMLSAKKAIQ